MHHPNKTVIKGGGQVSGGEGKGDRRKEKIAKLHFPKNNFLMSPRKQAAGKFLSDWDVKENNLTKEIRLEEGNCYSLMSTRQQMVRVFGANVLQTHLQSKPGILKKGSSKE